MMNELYSEKNKISAVVLKTAYRYLSYRSRTIHEMNLYLGTKGFTDQDISQAISHLKAHQYLDDRRFCQQYLEYQTLYRPKSKFAYAYDLRHKGVSSAIIDNALSIYDNEKLAKAAAVKRFKQLRNHDELKIKTKLLNYLKYRGFDYQTCMDALSAVKKDKKSDED